RALFTEEMNAAVRGAKRAGATEIVAVDCHGAGGGWSFKSLIPERLERGARWVFGYPWARYVAPLEQGVDAVLFVGAHARSGTPDGVLSHTVSSEAWRDAYINDVPVGESGILAAVCGVWGAPAVFVAGDTATCREVVDLLGEKVVTAPVKEGLGRYSARNLAPLEARELIEQRVYDALTARDWPDPYRPASPVTFRVELATTDQAGVFRGRSGVEILGPRTVVSTGATFWQAWDQFWYRS
ncbi:MAG: M55 family metallopeptidase, partial [Chloroflexi bacterium]|nr:M55 family metallopeptidase [Chloroflexota bacterium]